MVPSILWPRRTATLRSERIAAKQCIRSQPNRAVPSGGSKQI